MIKKSTKNEVKEKVGCTGKQPMFTLTNLNMMHTGIYLDKVVVPQLNINNIRKYCLANLEPPHIRAFECLALVEEKMHMLVNAQNRREANHKKKENLVVSSPSSELFVSGKSNNATR